MRLKKEIRDEIDKLCKELGVTYRIETGCFLYGTTPLMRNYGRVEINFSEKDLELEE